MQDYDLLSQKQVPSLDSNPILKDSPSKQRDSEEEFKNIEDLLRERPRSEAFSGPQTDFMRGFLCDLPKLKVELSSKKEALFKEEVISPAEFIRNIDTGEVLPLNDPKVSGFPVQNLKDKPWKSFLKDVKSKLLQVWDAAELGDLKTLKKLLTGENACTLDLNAKSLDQWTALHMACNEGHHEVVAFLLTQEVNVNAKTSMERTPLHLASMRGHSEIVHLLMNKGADIDAIDEDHYTAIHHAAERGCEKSVKLLLDKEARVDLRTREGMLASDLTQDFGIREMIREAKDLGESNFGRTAFGNIVRTTCRADYVKRLLTVSTQITYFSLKLQTLFNIYRNKTTFSKLMIENDKNLGPENFIFYKMLGKGSFGEVFLVKKKGTKTLYAMKVLDKDMILSKNLMKYVNAERNVLNILNHPFMVKLNCAFQNINKLFIVMEYCSG